MLIAVISDTHGLLRPEVLPLLAGADHILHLGDVGDDGILGRLAHMAQVTAIRGNIDRRGPCSLLPETEVVRLGGRDLYLLHNLAALDLDPRAAGFAAVLYGHSHRPEMQEQRGVFYLNPGSCGPRRFQLPVTMARLWIDDGKISAEIVSIDID